MFESLVKLSELYLNGNNFKKVPGSLSMLSQTLQYLHLNDNPIQVIYGASFSGELILMLKYLKQFIENIFF